MLVPLSWLREFIPVADDAAAVDRILTMLGLEVEGIDLSSGEPVLNVKLTPNKADSLSVFGVARELALVSDASLKMPSPSVDRFSRSGLKAEIRIEAPDLCPRYSGLVIEGISVKPAPQKLVRRLEQCGIRPINDAVDATNYILLELGHPLHAFDLDRLEGHRIVVRRAAAGEVLVTLDGTNRSLSPDNLVIADAKRPVALAGVMGGSNSEINPATKTILLESAYFDPVSIRRTSRKLGLHTEASHRFERGADYGATVRSLLACAELILSLNPGAKVSAVSDAYPAPPPARTVKYRNSRYSVITGTSVSFKEASTIIRKTGCLVQAEDAANETLTLEVPSWRPDLEREIDLIEEISRVAGYEKIPVLLPEVTPVSSELFEGFRNEFEAVRTLRTVLSGAGLNEAVNYSFESAEFNDKLGLPADGRISVVNPLDQNMGMMRTSLMPGLLSDLQRNTRFLHHDLGLFEIGNVFRDERGEPVQENRLALLLAGHRHDKQPYRAETEWDWFDLKGLVELAASSFGASLGFRPHTSPPAYAHKGRVAEIMIDGVPSGFLGQIGYAMVQQLEVKGPVFAMEFGLAGLLKAGARTKRYAPLEKLLPVRRDISLLVPSSIPASAVGEFIRGHSFVADAVLTDVYSDGKIGAANRALTYSVKLVQQAEKPLSDAEIASRVAELVGGLAAKLGLKQR